MPENFPFKSKNFCFVTFLPQPFLPFPLSISTSCSLSNRYFVAAQLSSARSPRSALPSALHHPKTRGDLSRCMLTHAISLIKRTVYMWLSPPSHTTYLSLSLFPSPALVVIKPIITDLF